MAQEEGPSSRECVLVVDDASSIRDFITEYILAPRGFEILTATDGLEGLRLAFDKQPDLMIVDVQMPNMDGLEMLRRLQLRRIIIGHPHHGSQLREGSHRGAAHGRSRLRAQALRRKGDG